MKVLGLIPARGGSKEVPRKNSKLLAGKPLIVYTIEAAMDSKLLSETIVSTDSEEIMTVAKTYGANIPFQRPHQLATDISPTIDTVVHALTYFEEQGEYFDAVCLLQATNPFRTSEFIDKAIDAFQNSGTDSLVSVLKVPHEFNPHWVFESDEKGQLQISTGETNIISRRQDLPAAYYRDGAIYITKTEVLLKQRSLFGKSIGFIESDEQRHVNIDTMEDWIRAEELAIKLGN